MKQALHRCAAIIATLCIGTFFISSLGVELLGGPEMIAKVKHLIVFPGLFILIPAIALTGATGFMLAGERQGQLIATKKKRMPFISMNGLIVLVPAAIFLNHLAAKQDFSWPFYLVQSLELIAGGVNLRFMLLNMRDGLKLTGKLRRTTRSKNTD